MENQTTVSENIPQPVPNQVNPVHVQKSNNIWKIFVLLLLLIIFGFLLWYILVGSKVPTTQSSQSTSSLTSVSQSSSIESSTISEESSTTSVTVIKKPEIVSLDANLNKYINYELGFSVKFPKIDNVATTCDEVSKEKTGKMPITTFNVTPNSFIISDQRVVQWWRTPCSVVDNTLYLLQNGFNKGEENLGDKNYPEHTYIAFNNIESDKDLQTIINLIPQYKSCYVGTKKLKANSTDVYEVTLVDKNGRTDDMESDCYINAMYYFYYSTTNMSAVLTSATQSTRFANDQSDVEIEFTKK